MMFVARKSQGTSMIYKNFDNKTGLWASQNEELVQELHKQVIEKLKEGEVCEV